MTTTTMGKWGNAAALRIPQALCDHLGVHIGEKVRLTAEPGRIVIEPDEERYTLRGRMAAWDGERFETSEYDWGNPQGKELW